MLNQIAKIYKPIPVLILGNGKTKEEMFREIPSLILER
jgi:hypothetical protein